MRSDINYRSNGKKELIELTTWQVSALRRKETKFPILISIIAQEAKIQFPSIEKGLIM